MLVLPTNQSQYRKGHKSLATPYLPLRPLTIIRSSRDFRIGYDFKVVSLILLYIVFLEKFFERSQCVLLLVIVVPLASTMYLIPAHKLGIVPD